MHTKGEWKWHLITSGLDEKDNYLRIYPESDSRKSIACIYLLGTPHKKREEYRANAQLIAAAPKLLEALKYAEENYDSERLNGAIYDKIKTAIAKAEGMDK